MLFKSSKTLPALRLYARGQLLYDGLLKDLPIKESVILEKSIAFFDDPEPCQIHRSALRIRLIADIEHEFAVVGEASAPGPLLLACSDFAVIDTATLIK